jgi:hypothetical protein
MTSDSGAIGSENVDQMEARPNVSAASCELGPSYYLQNTLKVVLAVELSAAIACLGSSMV